jgi:glycosyltransferase involved in cell wall biosynthesis
MINHRNRTRVVHLTSAHSATDVRIFHKECCTLAKAGYDVTLVAPHDREETINGVRIAPVSKPVDRFWRMMGTAYVVYRRARQLKGHLYHLHDPELLPWGLLLQKMTGSPVVYDSHEYLSLAVVDKAWLGKLARPVSKLSELVEKYIASRLAGVVVVDSHMAELFAPVCPRVAVASNFPWQKLAQAAPNARAAADTIIYVGGMSYHRGYELVLEAMPLVRAKKPQAVCHLLGELLQAGVRPEYTALSPGELQDRGVVFLPQVAYGRVPDYLTSHAVGWLPWRSCLNYNNAFPTKLLEYMAFGRPVVVSDLPAVSRVVKENDCGIVVPWDSPQAHAEALLQLFDNPEEGRRLGENGRRAVLEKFNWDRQVPHLLDLYESCLAAYRTRSG